MFVVTATTTDSPGKFWLVNAARTICRPCSTAAFHLGAGDDCGVHVHKKPDDE